MSFFEAATSVVKKVPRGKVATYGLIAAEIGHPQGARTVGWALHQLSGAELRTTPWHRIINREGRISTTCRDHTSDEQAALLKKEGVAVEYRDGNYFVDLQKYLWRPSKRYES